MSGYILRYIKVVFVVRFSWAKFELDIYLLVIGNVWSFLIENKVFLCLWMLVIVMGKFMEFCRLVVREGFLILS